MDRRAFFRRAAIVASGAIAADQLARLDRLPPEPTVDPFGVLNIAEDPTGVSGGKVVLLQLDEHYYWRPL